MIPNVTYEIPLILAGVSDCSGYNPFPCKQAPLFADMPTWSQCEDGWLRLCTVLHGCQKKTGFYPSLLKYVWSHLQIVCIWLYRCISTPSLSSQSATKSIVWTCATVVYHYRIYSKSIPLDVIINCKGFQTTNSVSPKPLTWRTLPISLWENVHFYFNFVPHIIVIILYNFPKKGSGND